MTDAPGSGGNPLLAAIEIHSIDFVPARERHGTLTGQARFWFLGNFNFATIPIGFIGPSLGLSFWWTVLAESIGILVGTLFQAFHASQGAELGLPQMIQSRAQFGYRGVVVPLFASLFTFVGFNIVNTILIAQGLSSICGWNPTVTALGASLLGGALAVWGYDWLHRVFTLMFWASVPLFALLTLGVMSGAAVLPPHAAGGFNAVGFFTQLAAGASYNITYAVFVSDYTRYLPVQTGRVRIICTVFVSSSLSAIWLIGLGAWLAVHFGATDALSDLVTAGGGMFPGFGTALAAVSMAALVAVIGMNGYSAMLTVLTAIDAFHPIQPARSARVMTIGVIICISAAAAIGFGGDVIATLNDYFVIMLYLLVPWTAVNLTDYFFVREGHYAILDLFKADGVYGVWSRCGLVAYVMGFAASFPFCVLPGVFTGPAAKALGGVDIGWLVGLVLTPPIYLWLMRGHDTAAEAYAISASRVLLERNPSRFEAGVPSAHLQESP
jgi:purine-cytosine permease-like protein